MNDTLLLFSTIWLLTQAASVLMLFIGSRYSNHHYLLKIGEIAHRKKVDALERVWPLTKIRSAVERHDALTCIVVLSSLIIVKSAASFVFGIIMVFWLPLASLIVPSIVAVHDPNDAGLLPWIKKVSLLQVTSHSLAAALGFVIFVGGLRSADPLPTIIWANLVLVTLVCIGSLGFAIAAGRAETAGVLQRGI